jgi:hypothetical protein
MLYHFEEIVVQSIEAETLEDAAREYAWRRLVDLENGFIEGYPELLRVRQASGEKCSREDAARWIDECYQSREQDHIQAMKDIRKGRGCDNRHTSRLL